MAVYCVRDHRRSTVDSSNTCQTCHREGAKLRARLRRVYRTLLAHDRQCRRPRDDCPDRAWLLERIDTRTRALNAWRALGLPRTVVA